MLILGTKCRAVKIGNPSYGVPEMAARPTAATARLSYRQFSRLLHRLIRENPRKSAAAFLCRREFRIHLPSPNTGRRPATMQANWGGLQTASNTREPVRRNRTSGPRPRISD